MKHQELLDYVQDYLPNNCLTAADAVDIIRTLNTAILGVVGAADAATGNPAVQKATAAYSGIRMRFLDSLLPLLISGLPCDDEDAIVDFYLALGVLVDSRKELLVRQEDGEQTAGEFLACHSSGLMQALSGMVYMSLLMPACPHWSYEDVRAKGNDFAARLHDIMKAEVAANGPPVPGSN